jgi:hypothetical protein
MAATELMWREGKRSSGAGGKEELREEKPPTHGRERRSPAGKEVAAAHGEAAAPTLLFPFACWRRHCRCGM